MQDSPKLIGYTYHWGFTPIAWESTRYKRHATLMAGGDLTMDLQKKFIEEASIRLALIQPSYNETYPDASKQAYYCRVTEKPIKMQIGRAHV